MPPLLREYARLGQMVSNAGRTREKN
nr:hypothetical protein [Candidatus Coxiella mudrowiae]